MEPLDPAELGVLIITMAVSLSVVAFMLGKIAQQLHNMKAKESKEQKDVVGHD